MGNANSPGGHLPADQPGSTSSPDTAAVSRVAEALRAEALRHAPDSAAILARVEDAARRSVRASRDRSTRPGSWLRPLVPAAAAFAVLVVACGNWLVAGHLGPHPTRKSARAGSASRHVSTATPSAGGGRAADGRSASPASPTVTAGARPTATAALGSPGNTRVQQGFLWSDGSVDKESTTSWSQSDITLKTKKTITALSVVLRLADTPELVNTGASSTVPAADIVTRVTPGHGVLVYTFRLRAGITLRRGTYEFACQYSHAPGGRNADDDTYLAIASAGQAPAEVYGNFFPVH
jgi:hypothetical protein